jgi:hypothetical protein
MESERIRGSDTLRERFMPRNLLRRRNNLRWRHRQRRHVQRLADVTRGLVAASMMVQDRAAAGEVKQRQASENGQRAL